MFSFMIKFPKYPRVISLDLSPTCVQIYHKGSGEIIQQIWNYKLYEYLKKYLPTSYWDKDDNLCIISTEALEVVEANISEFYN